MVAVPKYRQEQLRQLAQQDVMLSAAFARIVAILMRSPQYKHLALTDLEWLVMPPLMLGQYAMVDGKFAGVALPVPAAVALWASVSAEVDQRLSASLTAPIRLRPDEWRSGETLWLIDVIGDQHAIPHLMQQLQAGPFKGRAARMRMVGRDGKVVVAGLGAPAETEAASA
jgi:hemolysin-activating ACP:hemolysin acyltransferase